MYAFYVVRGYNLEYLANLRRREKWFLYYAMENYYKEIQSAFTGKEANS